MDYYSLIKLTQFLSSRPPSPSTPCSITFSAPPMPSSFTTILSESTPNGGLATERTPLLDPKPVLPSPAGSFHKPSPDPAIQSIHRTRLLLALSYASFSGVISGMCLLFAKSGVELLLLTVGGENQFWRWQSWTLLLGLIIFALLQLWYLHKALVLANPTLVCPRKYLEFFLSTSSLIAGKLPFAFTTCPQS